MKVRLKLCYSLVVALALDIHANLSVAVDLQATDVDTATIGTLEQAAGVWLSHGRTYGEQRYSPLKEINDRNVTQIGKAWEADLESARFGIEATPLFVDGVLYVTSSYSRVYAFAGKTGRRLWMYDPHVAQDWIRNGCCKPVNRGVALWKGKLFIGAYDGRLIALDARTGKQLWEVNTTESAHHYTITGAPLAVAGKVIIGNGGADYATRGYVSAYDAETGTFLWRFYVVPGDPKKGFEAPELAMAAKSWKAERDWSYGGDGNPWNALSYDVKSDLLYVGTGNGPSVNDQPKTNTGGGDNLFTSTILAIRAKTGGLAWYYQTTPGDQWDYDATQNLVLADVRVRGHTRPVLMQANKNGFFYVLDRISGNLLAADKFVYVNWASGVDLKTGKPRVVSANTDLADGAKIVFPGEYGAHNWMGMAFDPSANIAYIPATDIGWVEGVNPNAIFYLGYDTKNLTEVDLHKHAQGLLIAWDVTARKPKWAAAHSPIINGGVLATAGNLVVQGTGDGHIEFYDSRSGKLLKDIAIGTGIVASPISYSLDGVQYIAIGAGWNGWGHELPGKNTPPSYDNRGRLIVLKLGGGALDVAGRVQPPPYLDIDDPQPPELVEKGKVLYQNTCGDCHSLYGEGTGFPDLRRMSRNTYDHFRDVVLGGALKEGGMASFADKLSAEDADAIRAYITNWAQASRSAPLPEYPQITTQAVGPNH